MSDDEYDTHCPLCCEEMDLSDRNFLPCPCGYKVCMWCWHHIRENMNGLCPACRTPYNSDPHAFSAVDREDVVKLKKEKRQKEKQEKKTAERVVVSAPGAGVKSAASTVTDRRHLHNYRVVQRNLVYVIGVPANYASEENLRKPEFFGQYGKIGKVVIHRNHSSVHSTVSVYVTFVHKEDARASIQSLDGHWLDQNHLLRASFGTTKYCNNFIRGVPCNNPECVYLHDLGDDDDRFTKEEIQAGHSKIPPVPGKDQTLVTGGGGPSGTGKRPTGEPILPPPVFIQDNYPALGSGATSSTSASAPVGLSAPPGVAAGVMPAPGLSASSSTATTSTSVPLVPPGVGIALGRPAAVSRTGTGTWGSANTIAAITGAASIRSASTERERESERERERERERDDFRESHSNTPLHFPPLSSSVSSSNLHSQAQSEETNSRVPTAVLKRSASSTTNVSTLAAAAPAPVPVPVVDPTPPATTTATTAPASAPVAPAAGAAKIKPKTAKEIAREAAAEKKAAAAAARAEKVALAAQAAATASTDTSSTSAAAPAASANGEGESKSSTSTTAAPAIVPTPKLSAKQQMLANKAEKAAKAQAAALAAQEAREAARAAKESAKAAAREHALALHNGGMSKKDLKNAANSAPSTAAAANSAETLPPAHDSTLDLSILQQVASPVASMLEAPPDYTLVQGFNGLSVNSLFPVPVSSLSCSVWSNILRASNEDLSINPYGVLEVPVSELLDLMLPPVDAMLSSSPCWPRPLAYYTQGMQAGGVTFSPAGKHLHQRSVNDMALLPPMLQMLPSSVTQQQHQLHSQQQQRREPEITLSPAEQVALAQKRSKVAALLQAITTEAEEAEAAMSVPVPALAPPPGVSVPSAASRGVAGPVPGAVRSNGRTAGPAHLPPPPGVTPAVSAASATSSAGAAVGATNINALRQLFPGVKMSVSSSK